MIEAEGTTPSHATSSRATPSRRIRVLVADDHEILRIALHSFLVASDDMLPVGEAPNGAEAVRLCEQIKPDVVLMDLKMPEMDGVAATRLIRQSCPQTHILVLTSFDDGSMVREALLAGAIGYVLKNVSSDELAQAIRSAYIGQSTLSPRVLHTLVQ